MRENVRFNIDLIGEIGRGGISQLLKEKSWGDRHVIC